MATSEYDCYVTTHECPAAFRELPGLVDFAKRFFHETLGPDTDPLLLFNLELVVSEACTNVIKYAYPAERPGLVRLDLGRRPGELVIRIRDKGAPFDPCNAPEPDLENPRESGLGIFFVRELMDAMEYRREDGENVLVLAKSV